MSQGAFDILIRNGRILDGSGGPWYFGDLAIRGGIIAAVGYVGPATADRVIDAAGQIVSPGFIDLHTHGDFAHLADPDAAPRVMQGVTTDVIGQDGISYAPVNEESLRYFREQFRAVNGTPDVSYEWRSVGEFLAMFDGKTSLNVAFLMPHGAVRYLAMGGSENRAPTDGELSRMRELVAQGMDEGAVGLSTGLTYAPCSFASSDELVALCEVVAERGGAFMPHLRSYGSGVAQATDEVVDVARRSGVALHLTHHQCVFPVNEHRIAAYTDVLDRTRADGMDVTADSYPYIAGSTFIRGLLPAWSQAMPAPAFCDALRDPGSRERIRHEVEDVGCDGSHGVPMDWSKIRISGVKTESARRWMGVHVDEAAREMGRTEFDFVSDLLIGEQGEVTCVAFLGYEEAIQSIMRHPAHMVGSDSIHVGERPHPRAWGCHARYLARYVRDLGVLTLPEAIRKMTSAPAARIGLGDRGLLKAALAADVVVFDPDTIQDTATFDDPKRYADGVSLVIVNGQIVVENGVHTHARAGCALGARPT